MKASWKGLVLAFVLLTILAFAAGVWIFPKHSVDPGTSHQFTTRCGDFEAAVVLLAEKNKGIVQAIDNHGPEYMHVISALADQMSSMQFRRIGDLSKSADRFFTNPKFVGMPLSKMKDTDVLVIVQSASKPAIRGLRKDGYPAD